jgi:C2H2 transcription facotor
MAAAFRPVNTPLTPADTSKEDSAAAAATTIASPMTPRPNTAPSEPPKAMDDAATPTRATFGASALASQKPLPTSPFPESVQVPEAVDQSNIPKRENSQHSRKSKDSDEMDMDDSDGEGAAGDDAGSDDESVDADGTKSKKKKSQRFYCTDYPPCNLSFTRSEHLARHIR